MMQWWLIYTLWKRLYQVWYFYLSMVCCATHALCIVTFYTFTLVFDIANNFKHVVQYRSIYLICRVCDVYIFYFCVSYVNNITIFCTGSSCPIPMWIHIIHIHIRYISPWTVILCKIFAPYWPIYYFMSYML